MIKIYSDNKISFMYNTNLKKYSTFSGYGLRDLINNMLKGTHHYGWCNRLLSDEYRDTPLIAQTQTLETVFEDYPELFL